MIDQAFSVGATAAPELSMTEEKEVAIINYMYNYKYITTISVTIELNSGAQVHVIHFLCTAVNKKDYIYPIISEYLYCIHNLVHNN